MIKIDRAALLAALGVILAHEQLLIDAGKDLHANGLRAIEATNDVVCAIRHVLDDDFRSPETRGGS
jgi:hypothetical protein